VLHDGAEFGILQLLCWHRGQGCEPRSRCLAGTAADACKRLFADISGLIHGWQKVVLAALGHLPTEIALGTCDGGHVGHVCNTMVCFPEPVRVVGPPTAA
jgi:hypothetical protein